MDWDAIGAIGEIFGAAAVVISLLYLARQVRTQNMESRATAMHEFYVGWRDSATSFVDIDLAESFVRASDNFDSLSQAEKLRLIGIISGPVRLFEEAYFNHRQNRLDTDVWDAINRQFAELFSNGVYQEYWKLRRDWFSEEFQRHVDGLVQSGYKL